MPIISPLESYSPTGSHAPKHTGKVDLVITRYPAGTWVNRRFVKGVPTTVTLTGVSIQPFKDNEKIILPEAERTRDWVKIYSNQPLRTMKEGTDGHGADEFEFEGVKYQVAKVRHYSMGVLDHYKALAVSIEKTP